MQLVLLIKMILLNCIKAGELADAACATDLHDLVELHQVGCPPYTVSPLREIFLGDPPSIFLQILLIPFRSLGKGHPWLWLQ